MIKAEANNEFEKIKINDYNEDEKGSSLSQMMNDFYQTMDETIQLTAHSSIAGMDQIVVSTIQKPIIGTQALDTCFGILLYDRKNKFGICGHASPNNIIGMVVEMLKLIPINMETTFEYTIVPGYRAIEQRNFKAVNEIQDILNHYMSINPKICFTSLKTALSPHMPNGLLCYDFAFDTSSGKDVTDILFRNFIEAQNKRHI